MTLSAEALAHLHHLIDELARTNPECIDALDLFINGAMLSGAVRAAESYEERSVLGEIQAPISITSAGRLATNRAQRSIKSRRLSKRSVRL